MQVTRGSARTAMLAFLWETVTELERMRWEREVGEMKGSGSRVRRVRGWKDFRVHLEICRQKRGVAVKRSL